MSQFNSIFSPLTNKLARLAGITLLAVAALFASTQQMSAQSSCVQNVSISLDGRCEATVEIGQVVLGSTSGLYLKINDNNPTDDAAVAPNAKVNAVSPASGWSYGVFRNSDNALVCQGRIIVVDDFRPVFTAETKRHWGLIDTIVTWADNLSNIYQEDTWKSATVGVGTGTWFTGRPWLIDSCEINGSATGPNSPVLGSVDLKIRVDRNNTLVSGTDNSTAWPTTIDNIQIKVTDYLESPQCDSTAFQYKLRRSFQLIDRRGNDTTLNQIIYFQRPSNRGTEANPFVRATSGPDTDVNVDTIDKGPGNLGMFGPFGASAKRAVIEYNNTGSASTYGKYGYDKMTVTGSTQAPVGAYTKTTYNGPGQTTGIDTFLFDIGRSGGSCNVPPSDEAGYTQLLKEIYVAIDSTPIGARDSISLFDEQIKTRFNYSVSFTTTVFDACNTGKKFQFITTVMDWCGGALEKDTIIVKFEDTTAPAFTAKNPNQTVSPISGFAISGRRSWTSNATDSVNISVGTNDCTASLRLPAYNQSGAARTDGWERDLGQLFNWTVSDKCASNSVRLNYKFHTRDEFNNGYFIDRTTTGNNADGWREITNYTIASMNGGLVALGLPVGEHRIIIQAWDNCSNESQDTLYFDVFDGVAPVMKCDDIINVTLTSNSTSNYFLKNFALNNASQQSSRNDQYSRLYVDDINEGSRDNCTLDSMFVRRKVTAACITDYLAWNMDYDAFGKNPNGKVELDDFDQIGTTGVYYTPNHMQYVEFFCCDAAAGSLNPAVLMVELWGSHAQIPSLAKTGDNILGSNPNPSPNLNRNWSYCWTTINLEDKTPPQINAPNLNATYNATATNWMNCTGSSEKEWIGDPARSMQGNEWITVTNTPGGNSTVITDNTYDKALGKISSVQFSNARFGYPDIYGIECAGEVKYKVLKKLTCDTGFILRIWEVNKTVKAGTTITVRDTQIIFVQANHDYTINVPADEDRSCGQGASTSNVTFDEDGCDLLAISKIDDKVYNAAQGENACKKIYRTWTVINWCQLPNQFLCDNADPLTYARVIPRLQAVNTLANTNAKAVAMSHNIKKSVSTANNPASITSSTALSVRSKTDYTPANELQWWDSNNLTKTFPAGAMTGAATYSHGLTAATATTASTVTYQKLTPAQSGCSYVNSDQSFAWQYTQVIKIQDTNAPSISPANTFDVNDGGNTDPVNYAREAFGLRGNYDESTTGGTASTTGLECKAKVSFTFGVTDACDEITKLENFYVDSYYIADKMSPLSTTAITGLTDLSMSPADPIPAVGNGVKKFTFTGDNFSAGVHGAKRDYQLVVTLRDDCGNVRVDRIDFAVMDNKAPAPVCVQLLKATLMPTVGGGDGMVTIKATDVFQNIERNWTLEDCGPVKAKIIRETDVVSRPTSEATALSLLYNSTGISKDTVNLFCKDKGQDNRFRVYLIDAQGNYNYCTITVDLEDNLGLCGPLANGAAVAGAIQTETKATVEGVQVNLSGQSQKSFATGVNGLFVFNNLTAGADYTVTPSLNKGFLNGVSTFDLVLISKHILGVQPLNTPYKLIAADVNNSKSVTTLDLIQLRKLILNIDATFANNSSWRFVDASYTFPNASNPWAASFPEVKNVNDLVGSLSANFVAVKVGDVNGNAIANSTQGSVRNLTSNLGISVADMNLVAGNEYKVDFTAADLNGIEGFQFTLNLDKKGLELVDLVPGIAAEENFGIFAEEGVVTASWNGEAKGGVLFSLVVRAKSNTTLSEVLNLNSRYTAAEAYKGGEVVNVGLNFNASKASANYELYQNTPNPFAGESIIGFNLPAAGTATLTIQDVTGRTLKVINGQYAKGYNQVSLKSTELSATGVLTYTLKAADFTATRKMIIVE